MPILKYLQQFRVFLVGKLHEPKDVDNLTVMTLRLGSEKRTGKTTVFLAKTDDIIV